MVYLMQNYRFGGTYIRSKNKYRKVSIIRCSLSGEVYIITGIRIGYLTHSLTISAGYGYTMLAGEYW
jgi:hypothetical protein